jgi:RimJ/RimL family protein N-acetyltransferase
MAVLPPQSFSLETERFLIRPMVAADASPALEEWTTDANAAEMLNMKQRRWAVADQAAFFAKNDGKTGNYLLGIFAKSEKAPIGVYKMKFQPANAIFVITHFIGDHDWRRQHVTTETTEVLYDYLFNQLGYKKAKANVRPHNRPVLWLMLRGGWRQEAHLVKHLRDATTGERGDILVLGMLADEWRESLVQPPRLAISTVPKPPVQRPS